MLTAVTVKFNEYSKCKIIFFSYRIQFAWWQWFFSTDWTRKNERLYVNPMRNIR